MTTRVNHVNLHIPWIIPSNFKLAVYMTFAKELLKKCSQFNFNLTLVFAFAIDSKSLSLYFAEWIDLNLNRNLNKLKKYQFIIIF